MPATGALACFCFVPSAIRWLLQGRSRLSVQAYQHKYNSMADTMLPCSIGIAGSGRRHIPTAVCMWASGARASAAATASSVPQRAMRTSASGLRTSCMVRVEEGRAPYQGWGGRDFRASSRHCISAHDCYSPSPFSPCCSLPLSHSAGSPRLATLLPPLPCSILLPPLSRSLCSPPPLTSTLHQPSFSLTSFPCLPPSPLLSGHGRWTFPDGSYFEGRYEGGGRVQGTLTSADGREVYQGE